MKAILAKAQANSICKANTATGAIYSLSLSRLWVAKTHNLWLVRSSLVDLTRFLAYFLAINFFTLLKSLNFLNFSTLFARFSLSARRKFINFTRKFNQEFTKCTQNLNKFTNFYFYGLPRLALVRLAMMDGQKFKTNFKHLTLINLDRKGELWQQLAQRAGQEQSHR